MNNEAREKARQICCWMWAFYTVQPDWLATRWMRDFVPKFVNPAIAARFRQLESQYGLEFRGVVDECGRMGEAERQRLANLIAPEMLQGFPQAMEGAAKGTKTEYVEGERHISFSED